MEGWLRTQAGVAVADLLKVTEAQPPVVVADGLSLFLNTYDPSSYSGSGSVWNDVSGNNRNFTWTSVSYVTGTTNYFETNGRLARGPASNSFGITNTSGYTVQMLMFQNSAATSSAFKWYSSNGAANSSTGRGFFAHCTWSDGVIYFDQGGCCNSDTRTSVSGGTMNVWNVISFRRGPNSQRDIWKDTTRLISNTASAANINLNSTAADIGGTQEGTTWNARLAAFVVYNRNLSDAELQENATNLKIAHNA
jgi:hypothetical protein